MFEPHRNYSREQFWEIVENDPQHKYEYVNGYVRMMSGGSPAHAQLGVNVSTALNIALRDSECNVYSSDALVELDMSRCYQPDVSVSCDPYDWTRKKALEAPTVVVEVLSPSTEHIDKGEKLEVYKRYPTIQEILLVDSRRCHVRHYHRIVQQEWQLRTYENDGDVIYLASIEVSLSLHDIYRKVYLELEEAGS